MVRPYGVKGRKLKKRKVEEPAPVEEEEEEVLSDEGEGVGVEEGTENGGEIAETEDEKRAEEAVNEMPGIPITAPVDKTKRPGVVFVLEKACLEVGKVGKVSQSHSRVSNRGFGSRVFSAVVALKPWF